MFVAGLWSFWVVLEFAGHLQEILHHRHGLPLVPRSLEHPTDFGDQLMRCLHGLLFVFLPACLGG